METRIQLCGPLVARIDGRRIEGELPGRQVRLLFAALVLERRHPADRAALQEVLWGTEPPPAVGSALSALLSKLRRVAPLGEGPDVQLALPPGTWVDLEVATAALHRAEGAVARGDWHSAWGPARVAQHVLDRPFLAGEHGPWVGARRALNDASLARALELAGRAALQIGGAELDTAERAARRLVELAPLRESGTRLLMDVLERQGNRAEALVAYDALRRLLRSELGVSPSPETIRRHRALLEA